MALFKILRGLKSKLPSTKTDGYCWYTTDDSLLYIDYEDDNGVLQRKALNAKDAQTLSGASLSTSITSSDIEIPTSKTILSALNGKSNTNHTHTVTANAFDDDVVILSGTSGIDDVTYSATHATKGPSAGYTSGNTTTSISGSGSSGTIKIPQITVDKYGHVTAASDEDVVITMPTLPVIDSALSSTSTNTVQNKVINSALSGKAPTSHASTATTYGVSSASNYGHVMASSTTPKANGTAAVGSETAKFARGDHVHPLQTTVSGNAGTATKLATSRTISLTGDVTGSGSFDGSANLSITATIADDSHNHVVSNVDGLQASLDAKQATVTGGATTITGSNLTASRALISNSSGKVAVSAVTSTELGYLDGVTSSIQTQLNNKSNTSHSHSLESLKLTDTVTGTQYTLSVTNGKLIMVKC